MKNTFLVGSFLPGYSSAFRYKPALNAQQPAFSLETLADRFHHRAERFERKGNHYMLAFQAGILLALALGILAFTIPLSFESNFEVVQVEQELVTMEEIQQTRQQVQPPPPPRPMILVAVPDDEILEEEDLDLDVTLELEEELVNLEVPTVPDEEEKAEPEIFVVVEQMPKMIGGMASLVKNLEYPVIAQKQGIEGNVIVQIVVDEHGQPHNPRVVRSASPLLNEAATNAVMEQRFEPGRQRGRAVKVEVAIPVKFRLTG